MQITIPKSFSILLLCLGLCACSGKGIKDNVQENLQAGNESSQEIFFGEGVTQEKVETEWNNVDNEQVYSLNNKATLFGDYLIINSMRTNLIFYDKDDAGNFHSWQFPEDFLPGVMRTYCHFKYKDQLICISQIEGGDSEIIIYDSSFVVKDRKKLTIFNPQYISGKLLYGHTNSVDRTIIKAIDLETLEVRDIYALELEKRPDFIINNNREMIVCEHPEIDKTLYFKYNNELLTPIFETKNSVLVSYDYRGVFYLEENTDSHWNLMIWDGMDIHMIEKVKIDDMDEWIFSNGLPGNIIIEENFFVSIHTLPEEPYLLIHSFDSKQDTKIALKKWSFTEADMWRYGETFSGIYYENGQIINYFFSNKADMLQTQTIVIK